MGGRSDRSSVTEPSAGAGLGAWITAANSSRPEPRLRAGHKSVPARGASCHTRPVFCEGARFPKKGEDVADLPYVINPGTLEKFFSTIQNTGVPGKVTQKYLESIGFKSKNDRYLLAFLKDLGFLKPDGTPSEVWHDYRHTGEAKTVMASAVRKAWPGLFQLYPDAYRKDDEALRNWMRTHAPSASPITVERSLKAFKSVARLADFSDATGQPPAPATSLPANTSQGTMSPPLTAIPALTRQATPEVVINIQLEIPATTDPDTYDQFFAAMRRHLFPGDN